MNLCSILDCGRKYYAKGLCHYHYSKSLGLFTEAHRTTKKRKCFVLGCERGHFARGYCRNHYHKNITLGNGKPLYDRAIDPSYGRKGEDNGMWNGGTSPYPNHYLMKKHRKARIEKTNGSCEKCGKKHYRPNLHHRDGSKDKHTDENFILLCPSCHMKMHRSLTI